MSDENKKGITVKIDADLHAQVKAYIESRGMTMAEFITAACDDLLHPKITEKEEKKMENMRTVAFQVSESLFQRIKEYLQRNNMTQRQFLLGDSRLHPNKTHIQFHPGLRLPHDPGNCR